MVADPEHARLELIGMLVAVGQEDRDAFRRLHVATAAKLFGICLRICGERQAAEDVLQEVYVTIWKRAGGFEPHRASPVTWLAAIARNRAIDWKRMAGRRHEAPDDRVGEPVDPAPIASDRLLLDEEERALLDCLDELVDAQRAAIRTAFFGGLTYAELAAREDVPVATMKSRIRRGLLHLRECLDD